MLIKGGRLDEYSVRIVFLGTSAAIPTAKRGLACVCVQSGGEILMFDAGEGAQMAFGRAGLGWNKKMSVFVSHLHGDHCLGLLGIIQTMSLQRRTQKVRVYGPPGTTEFIETNMRMLGTAPPFEVVTAEITGGPVCGGEGYAVRACASEHTVRSYAYLLEENGRPGRFDPAKARMLGVPEGPLWGSLQGGRSVRVGDAVVEPGQVLGPRRPGRKIGYSGDSRPAGRLERFFAGCDYLIFDSTFGSDQGGRARKTGHSTAAEAATLAKDAGVKNLILTHFSARYQSEAVLEEEAGRIHGSVVAAHDGMVVDV